MRIQRSKRIGASRPVSAGAAAALAVLVALTVPTAAGAGAGAWTTSGPEGGPVRGLAQDPASPMTLYAATGNGIFKSTNSAGTWARAAAGLPVGTPERPVVAPDGTIWTHLAFSGTSTRLYRSTDGGSSWIETDPALGLPETMAIDPVDSNTIYVGTRASGVLKSTDGGATWSSSTGGLTGASGTPHIWALAIDPVTPSILYAATSNDGVFKSVDSGATWAAASTGLSATGLRTRAIEVDANSSTTLYLGTNDGVFKSTDSAANWAQAASGMAYATRIDAIAIDPVTPATLYAAGRATVFKSTDSAASWSDLALGRPGLGIDDLLIDASAPAKLFAAADSGVLASIDSGATWSEANDGLRGFASGILEVDPTDSDVLYTANTGIFKSTDGGGTWSAVNGGLANLNIQALAISPSLPTTLYATDSSQIYRSTTGGGGWTSQIADPTPFGLFGVFVTALAVHPAAPDTVFAGNTPYRFDPYAIDPAILRSTDGAATWTAVYAPAPVDLANNGYYFPWAFAADPADSAKMILTSWIAEGGTSSLQAVRTTDGGDNWTKVLDQSGYTASYVVYDPNTPANVYIGAFPRSATTEAWKSADGGATWAGLELPLDCARDVAVDPVSSSVLYAACTDLHVSFDGGASWGTLTDDSIPDVYRVKAVPASSRTLYISTAGGVYENTLDLADLAITKSNGVDGLEAGDPVTYTLTVSNPAGPDEVVGATVSDPLPPELTSCSWTCAGSGGGLCTAGPVAGGIADSVTLPAGASVTYTLSCTVDPAAAGTVSNTATAAMPAGAVDPFPANNAATDTDDVLGSLTADVSISKSNYQEGVTIGSTIAYTLVVSNAGPDDVTGASVEDSVPAELTCTWTCAPSGAASCTASPVGGDLLDTADIPAGDSVTYSGVCDVSAAASGTLENTATVGVPASTNDPDPANNSATDSDALGPDPPTTRELVGEVTGTVIIEAQQTITVTDLIIRAGATLTLRAGQGVDLGNGLVIEPGATLIIEIDPTLLP